MEHKHQINHSGLSSLFSTVLMALIAAAFITACSQKPSAEETEAQNKALVEQAVDEAKKSMLADQTAEKARQDEAAAVRIQEKNKHQAAVAEAKKQLLAEQRAADVKTKANKTVETAKITCSNCGTIISVNEVETEGKGSGLGVVAGGVVGGLLGNQVGNGTGKDVATIAGVVGGAIAGNKIEKTSKKTKSFEIRVKMDTGEEILVRQATAPNIAKGDAVKIENEVVMKR